MFIHRNARVLHDVHVCTCTCVFICMYMYAHVHVHLCISLKMATDMRSDPYTCMYIMYICGFRRGTPDTGIHTYQQVQYCHWLGRQYQFVC